MVAGRDLGSSFEDFVGEQLLLLGECLMAEHRRLLRQQRLELEQEQRDHRAVVEGARLLVERNLHAAAEASAVGSSSPSLVIVTSSSTPNEEGVHAGPGGVVGNVSFQLAPEAISRSTSRASSMSSDLSEVIASAASAGSEASGGAAGSSATASGAAQDSSATRSCKKSQTWVAPIPEDEEASQAKPEPPKQALLPPPAVPARLRRKSAPSLGCIMENPRRHHVMDQASSLDSAQQRPRTSGGLEAAAPAGRSALAEKLRPRFAEPPAPPPGLGPGTPTAPPASPLLLPERSRRPSTVSVMTVQSSCSNMTAQSGRSAATSSLLRSLGVLPSSLRPAEPPERAHSPQLMPSSSVVGSFGPAPSHIVSGSVLGISREESEIEKTTFAALPIWQHKAHLATQSLRNSRVDDLGCLPRDPQELLKALALQEPCGGNPARERCLELWRRAVAAPSSGRRLCWDVLTLGFVAHDAFAVPLQFLGLQDSASARALSWASRAFWTCDMPVSLLSGYERSDGNAELRPERVAARYARTWLLPDALLVAAAWAEVWPWLLAGGGQALLVVQTLRMFRLVRVLRIRSALAVLTTRLRSERAALLVSILQSMAAVIFVVHVVACCWAGLGRFEGRGWVAHLGMEAGRPWEQYAVSFHWSLTQFYGSMDLQPSTPLERAFAILALLNGFFIATAFVSSVTSSMTRLHIITSKQAAHLRTLSKYLQEQRISRRLASRVQQNAKHALTEQQRNISEADVELLQLVSQPLQMELHFEVYAPVLAAHPLFGLLQRANPAAMRHVCHSAVSVMPVSQDDRLFSRGEVPACPKMLFVTHGELQYSQDGEHFQYLMAGEWACEPVLWTSWVYHGELIATTDCRLVALDARVFQELAGRCQTAELELSRYALEYLKTLNASSCMRSDLGSSVDTGSLVAVAYPQSGPQEEAAWASPAALLSAGTPRSRRHSTSQVCPSMDFSSITPPSAEPPGRPERRPSSSGLSTPSSHSAQQG